MKWTGQGHFPKGHWKGARFLDGISQTHSCWSAGPVQVCALHLSPGRTGLVATAVGLRQHFPPGGAGPTRSFSLHPGNCRHSLTPCDPDPNAPRVPSSRARPLSVSLSLPSAPRLGVGSPAKKSPRKGTPAWFLRGRVGADEGLGVGGVERDSPSAVCPSPWGPALALS